VPITTLWVRIQLKGGVLYTTLCDKVCQWLATGQWFTPGTPISSTNKTDWQYNWNIFESGIKYYNPNTYRSQMQDKISVWVTMTLTFDLMTPKLIGYFYSWKVTIGLVKIWGTELNDREPIIVAHLPFKTNNWPQGRGYGYGV
jgi:hypothetical protein